MEKIFNQMAAKAKKSEVKEAFIETFSGVFMEPFVKIVNGIKLLTIFTKVSVLDVWLGSKYTCFLKILEKKDFVISLNTQL